MPCCCACSHCCFPRFLIAEKIHALNRLVNQLTYAALQLLLGNPPPRPGLLLHSAPPCKSVLEVVPSCTPWYMCVHKASHTFMSACVNSKSCACACAWCACAWAHSYSCMLVRVKTHIQAFTQLRVYLFGCVKGTSEENLQFSNSNLVTI